MSLTDRDLNAALRNIGLLDPVQKAHVLRLLEERDHLRKLQDARDHFIPFVKQVWPAFIPGAHHNLVGEAFERVISGKSKRLIINMGPRHTKSELASVMLPAWYLGKRPSKKIIQTSNTEGLAAGFGRRVRNMIAGEITETEDNIRSASYAEIFPDIKLAADSKAAAGWHTNFGGEYFAIGVSGRVTGKGSDCAYFSCRCLTKRGYLAIADVRVGDEVLGYDHARRKTAWTKVRAISTQRKPRVIDVNGFICTPEHRVYTRRGYQRALAAGTYPNDVLTVPEGFRTRFDGLPPVDPENWQTAYSPVLLGRMSAQPGNFQMPAMRGLESPNGYHLQSVLSERQARVLDVSPLRKSYKTSAIGTRKEHREIRRSGEHLLQSHLLPSAQSSSAPETSAFYGYMREVRSTGSSSERQVLLNKMLHRAGADTGSIQPSIYRAVEPRTTQSQRTIQGYVRDVRAGKSADTGASHRPRRDTPPQTEFGSSMRALPRVLSSSDDGRCARDYEESLSGTGHWVVDLQTDTHNFFCEGVLAHNCLIIDDPHSEQEAKQAEYSPAIFDSVYDWYTSGPRQRLQPGGAIIIVMTRWSKRDLTGRLIDKMQQRATNDSGDQWEVIELPAILDEGLETERPMWPGFWSLKELQDTREEIGPLKFKAQYQQQPTSEQSAILKRDYWRIWGEDKEVDLKAGRTSCPGPQHAVAWGKLDPPACDFVIQSWDCASTKNDRSHPSAMTEWGVFRVEDPITSKPLNNIILLSAYKARMEFPELKKKAKQFYEESQPDSLLIENKSAGMQLLQEFRSMGIPAEDFAGSSRGTKALPNDKIARANLIADIFASGYVWMPDRKFAEEVRSECAEFPHGMTDDLVDSTVQALLRFRAGGLIRTANDEEEERDQPRAHRRRYY